MAPTSPLNGAGVDTAQFRVHSTRAASTPAALSSGVPMDVVLRAAGWSSESTFTRFYRKEPAVNNIMWDSVGFLSPQKLDKCC